MKRMIAVLVLAAACGGEASQDSNAIAAGGAGGSPGEGGAGGTIGGCDCALYQVCSPDGCIPAGATGPNGSPQLGAMAITPRFWGVPRLDEIQSFRLRIYFERDAAGHDFECDRALAADRDAADLNVIKLSEGRFGEGYESVSVDGVPVGWVSAILEFHGDADGTDLIAEGCGEDFLVPDQDHIDRLNTHSMAVNGATEG